MKEDVKVSFEAMKGKIVLKKYQIKKCIGCTALSNVFLGTILMSLIIRNKCKYKESSRNKDSKLVPNHRINS